MGDMCQDVLNRIQTYLDGECPQDIAAVVRQHLEDCPPCEHRADFQAGLKQIIAGACREEAPENLSAQVMARLDMT